MFKEDAVLNIPAEISEVEKPAEKIAEQQIPFEENITLPAKETRKFESFDRNKLMDQKTELYLKYAAKNKNLFHYLNDSLKEFYDYVDNNKHLDQSLVGKLGSIVERVNSMPDEDMGTLGTRFINKIIFKELRTPVETNTDKALALIDEMMEHAINGMRTHSFIQKIDFGQKTKYVFYEKNKLIYDRDGDRYNPMKVDVSNSTATFIMQHPESHIETRNRDGEVVDSNKHEMEFEIKRHEDFSKRGVFANCRSVTIYHHGREVNTTRNTLKHNRDLIVEGTKKGEPIKIL